MYKNIASKSMCELESMLQDFLFSNKRESKIHIHVHVHVNTLYNVRQNNRKWCKTKTGIFAKAGCLNILVLIL